MKLSLLLLIALLAIATSEHVTANNGLPLVKADYPVCATVEGPSLLRSPDSQHDYRMGEHFNDKGTA